MKKKNDVIRNQYLSSAYTLLKRAIVSLKPPEKLSTSEWADKYSVLSKEDSKRPGRWQTSEFEYQRAVMDSMSNPKVKYTIWVSGTQFGKTSLLRNDIGRKMDIDPGPMMLIEPTLDMAESFSKDRFSPFIRDTPKIKNLIRDNRARDSGNTLLHKKFPGGFIVFSGANSASSLAMRPIGRLYLDEVDRYPLELERHGDPVEQAVSRTTEFWDAKIIMTSTPTDQNSKIWQAYLTTNMQQYYVECPHCKNRITLTFKNLKWSKENEKIKNIYYECPASKCKIDEKHKKKMIRHGVWIADKPEITDRDGFWINALYKPYAAWVELINKFERAKHDKSKLQVFINNELAEIYENRGDAPDHLHIYAKREFYQIGSIPSPDVVFLTGAVDVQRNRFEIEVKGWTQNQESYSIEHIVYMCDTTNLESYNVLDDFLRRKYLHPSGAYLQVKGLAIDTSDNTQTVYTWVRRQELGRVFAIKGVTINQAINKPTQVDINFKGQKIANGVTLWGIGVSVLKAEFYAKLRMVQNEDGSFPFGFYHFPDHPEEYFKQMVSESLIVKLVNGIKKFLWVKIYERNETLDLNIYNRAMALILGIDNLSESEWQRAKESLTVLADRKPKQVAQKKSCMLSKGISLD